MAKFPTEVERSVTIKVPLERAYQYLWDVVGSSGCIPGIDTCTRVDDDTYRFIYQQRSTGPVSMIVRYTARYATNGKDRVTFEGTSGDNDNTDISGAIRLQPTGSAATKIVLRQHLAPDTPVPRLLQSFLRSFVEQEAADGVKQYLANVKKALEAG